MVASPARTHTRPLQLTPFIGREKELADIATRLARPDCRLLSLVGPGGIGKTRLAIQAASQQLHSFTHGVFFIPLTTVNSAESLALTVAENCKFSLQGAQAPKIQLLNYLGEKTMLLVLDNFEHLVAEAQFLLELLEHCPGLKILVTSLERLNVKGEWILEVAGLDYPDDSASRNLNAYSAVQLFVESASRHCPTFALTDANGRDLARICQLVQGVPLGIELAAAWVSTLSCAEIASEIERDLDFLTTSLRDVPERHRSLRAVFEHAWNSLAAEEQSILKVLSLFPAGFRREAAEQVASASLAQISELVCKSFLRRNPSGRYEMHALLRRYIGRELERAPAVAKKVQNSYCQYYGSFLRSRAEWLRGEKQKEVLDEISAEVDNAALAWQWAVAQTDVDVIGQATQSLFFFYDMQSRCQQGVELFARAAAALEAVCDRGPEVELVLAQVLARQARLCYRLTSYDQAQELFEKSIRILTRLQAADELAFAYAYLGDVCRVRGNYDAARGYLESSLSLSQAGDPYTRTLALNNLGIVASLQGRYDEAEELYHKCLELHQTLGNRRGVTHVLNNLGGIAFLQQDYARAKQLYQESLVIEKEIGELRGLAVALENLGEVACALGDYAEAKRIYQETLAIVREIGDHHQSAYTLLNLGKASRALGECRVAHEYFFQALRLTRAFQIVPLALNALLGVSALWQKEGEAARAQELVAFVLSQPAVDEEAKEEALRLRAELETALGPQLGATAEERGRGRTLDDWVAEILAEEKFERVPTDAR